ncbi:MAG: spore coat associated protein CotJA [Clostridia bacterium]|nr:spore coat associated protein CotJA [Clostridia bacterium]
MGLRGYPLASVYSPLQNFEDIYDLETGLTRGTIFQRLDLPFVCGGMSGGVARG